MAAPPRYPVGLFPRGLVIGEAAKPAHSAGVVGQFVNRAEFFPVCRQAPAPVKLHRDIANVDGFVSLTRGGSPRSGFGFTHAAGCRQSVGKSQE
jgi:hypothetical protein